MANGVEVEPSPPEYPDSALRDKLQAAVIPRIFVRLVRTIDRIVYRAPISVKVYLNEIATGGRNDDPELVVLSQMARLMGLATRDLEPIVDDEHLNRDRSRAQRRYLLGSSPGARCSRLGVAGIPFPVYQARVPHFGSRSREIARERGTSCAH